MSSLPRLRKPNPSKLELSIFATCGQASIPFLRRMVPRAHCLLHSPLAELSIALVGNVKMAALHQEFLNLPGPTDVLTFPLEINARGHATIGEIVICVPYAAKQARLHGVPVRHEVLLYAVHGLLHLIGYDDRTDTAFKAMHAREDQILKKLNVGPIFARPAAVISSRGPGRRRA